MTIIVRNDHGKLDAYAWPGGYPIFYLAADSEPFCPACANGENGSDARTEPDPDDPNSDKQWLLVACGIHWEGPPMHCAHCNAQIESAYGDPDDA